MPVLGTIEVAKDPGLSAQKAAFGGGNGGN